MENDVERLPVLKLTEHGSESFEDVVAREAPLTIILNNQEIVTLLCTPRNLDYLAVGFLFSEGLLENRGEIKKTLVDRERGIVRMDTTEDRTLPAETLFKRFITSGCGRGATFYSAIDAQDMTAVESDTKVSARQVMELTSDFQHQSELYRTTGGVHSAALCDPERILAFNEDIGRHNAIDKVFGECVMNNIQTAGKIVLTSGRISSEILMKVARRNVPILVSKSAPTDLGVRLAKQLGITLVGFVRGKRINVYANDWRILRDA